MSTNYKAEAVLQLAKKIKDAGFRVFIAKSGSYGFFTDVEGVRVVSFQHDLGGFKFSGNYKPVNSGHGGSTGTGWVIGDTYEVDPRGLKVMFESGPPSWATRGHAVTLTKLEQHLARYQSSSQYTEFLE